MRVEADRAVCIGAGMCALTAPEVFTQDDDTGAVVVLEPAPEPEQWAPVREAGRLCPSRALTVHP